MDEIQREVYNRFGSNSLDFDPRHDEIKLLADIGVVYIGWGIVAYIFTLPQAARSCRTWIAIVGLALLALEISFCLTEQSIPNVFSKHITEYEFIILCHSCFPLIIALLRCLSEALYVDIDKSTVEVLNSVTTTQLVS